MVGDGRGGVWLLCDSTDNGVSNIKLWRANQNDESQRFESSSVDDYPEESKMVGDGCGGVWILCDKDAPEGSWKLWHADEKGESPRYNYPQNSQMVGDGRGGVWLLCDSTDNGVSNIKLWRANQNDESQRFESSSYDDYPEESKMVGDGCGGVWILFDSGCWHASILAQILLDAWHRMKDLKRAGDDGRKEALTKFHEAICSTIKDLKPKSLEMVKGALSKAITPPSMLDAVGNIQLKQLAKALNQGKWAGPSRKEELVEFLNRTLSLGAPMAQSDVSTSADIASSPAASSAAGPSGVNGAGANEPSLAEVLIPHLHPAPCTLCTMHRAPHAPSARLTDDKQ
eukprot:scaffold19260_cov66-Phaeocystis_antarctica.AAC.8